MGAHYNHTTMSLNPSDQGSSDWAHQEAGRRQCPVSIPQYEPGQFRRSWSSASRSPGEVRLNPSIQIRAVPTAHLASLEWKGVKWPVFPTSPGEFVFNAQRVPFAGSSSCKPWQDSSSFSQMSNREVGRAEVRSQSLNTDQGNSEFASPRLVPFPPYRSGQFGLYSRARG
jgi:hypothetical protein